LKGKRRLELEAQAEKSTGEAGEVGECKPKGGSGMK
jgi:hypothetical protein